jgi:oligopeptide/dipeptide ABC transporter ATP-binding protein
MGADRQKTSDDALLSVHGLRTEFQTGTSSVAAVRDIDFTVCRGERVGLVGESGSGKSAFALSLLGLIEPPGRVVGGEIWLNGRDIRGLSDRELGRIRGKEMSLVFQDPMTALNPVKRIGAQLVEALRRHSNDSRKTARRRAIELLRDVEVPAPERRLDDFPHQYSGGMKQRVMIAIALANDPDLIIADEPTTALDVTTQAQILDLLLRAVEERGTAVVLISHDLMVVRDFCTRLAVMYAGRVIEASPGASAFSVPRHPYTQALLRSVPTHAQRRPQRLETISGSPPDLAKLPHGCAFEPRCPVGNGNDVCLHRAPPQTQVDEAVVECHFPAGTERVERS